MGNVFVIVQDHQARVELRVELERTGYSVYSAASRSDADTLLSSGTVPDFIILDFDYQALPARDFIVAIKSSTLFGRVPIVELTAAGKSKSGESCCAFEKPVDAKKIAAALASYSAKTTYGS